MTTDTTMKLDRRFNQMALQACFAAIRDHKKYTDFNTLGLYRSILENQRFTLAEKIELREYAHQFFKKSFDFLQVKDPFTFISVNTLGEDLTDADLHQAWVDIWRYQDKVLAEKRIKHRNFGIYAKHDCPYDDCPYKGVMVRQGSPLAGAPGLLMRGRTRADSAQSHRQRADRKGQRQLINQILETDLCL